MKNPRRLTKGHRSVRVKGSCSFIRQCYRRNPKGYYIGHRIVGTGELEHGVVIPEAFYMMMWWMKL